MVMRCTSRLADGPHYALSYRHQYCSIRDRLWEARYPRILAEIDGYDADVLCLQETTATTFRKNFAVDLQASDYPNPHPDRNPNPNGTRRPRATVRSTRFETAKPGTTPRQSSCGTRR